MRVSPCGTHGVGSVSPCGTRGVGSAPDKKTFFAPHIFNWQSEAIHDNENIWYVYKLLRKQKHDASGFSTMLLDFALTDSRKIVEELRAEVKYL